MNSSLDPKHEAQNSKSPRRLIGGSMLAWFAGQIRSAFRILSAAWTGPASNGLNPTSSEESATSPQAPTLTRENAVEEPGFTAQNPAEKEQNDAPYSMLLAGPSSTRKNALPSSEAGDEFGIPSPAFTSDSFKPRATSAPPIAFQTGSPNATIAAPAHPSELLAAVRTLHETTSEQDRNTVTRDELKREVDTLRRLIESRK